MRPIVLRSVCFSWALPPRERVFKTSACASLLPDAHGALSWGWYPGAPTREGPAVLRSAVRLGKSAGPESPESAASPRRDPAPVVGEGQGSKGDRNLPRPTEVNALTNLAQAQGVLGKTAEALLSAQEALQVSRSVGERGAECNSLLLIGQLHVWAGNADEAKSFLKQARSMAQSLPDEEIERQASYIRTHTYTYTYTYTHIPKPIITSNSYLCVCIYIYIQYIYIYI